MATVTERPVSSWSHALIRNVSWEDYEAFLDWLGDHNEVKVNYSDGKMEIMAPLIKHDREKSVTGRLFERLCEELDQETCSGGGVTLKKRLAEKGLEPDECYWLRNEAAMRGKQELDLEFDPPPDLAIEVENTRTILARLPIYAGIGVPEVWRWHDERFEVLVLGADGEYRASETSPSFPDLPMAGFSRFVARCYDVSELTLVKEFVAWVREGMPPMV